MRVTIVEHVDWMRKRLEEICEAFKEAVRLSDLLVMSMTNFCCVSQAAIARTARGTREINRQTAASCSRIPMRISQAACRKLPPPRAPGSSTSRWRVPLDVLKEIGSKLGSHIPELWVKDVDSAHLQHQQVLCGQSRGRCRRTTHFALCVVREMTKASYKS